MMKFNHNGKNYRLVFKHGKAIAPTFKGLIPTVRRTLRDKMRETILNSTKENRRDPIEFTVDVKKFQNLTELPDIITQPKMYRMTSAFLVDMDEQKVAYGPTTAVCVPPDIFEKEIGRGSAVIMLARQLNDVDFANKMCVTYYTGV